MLIHSQYYETFELPSDDHVVSDRLWFEYTARAYADFLVGHDDFSQDDKELETLVEEKEERLKKSVQELTALKEKMLREIDELTNGPVRHKIPVERISKRFVIASDPFNVNLFALSDIVESRGTSYCAKEDV